MVEDTGGGRPLRIALLTYRGNPFSGGQGVYVRYLSRGLVALGHQVTVLSGPPYPELDEGVELVRIRGLDLFAKLGQPVAQIREIRNPVDFYEWLAVQGGFFPEPLTFGLRALQHLRRHNGFDIVHDNQSLSYGLLGMQRLGLPVVATIHHPIHIDRDLSLQATRNPFTRLRLRRWYSFLTMQTYVSRRLPLLISVSESSGRESGRAFGVPSDRIRTVYNGVDTDLFRRPDRVERDPRSIIVVTSADTPIKGLQHFYEAIERLVRRRNVDVRIVGTPMNPERTRQELERRGVTDRVRFLGRLDREALVDAYASAAVAVVPSMYEGFGFPAAEAMACEAPVVAYDAGALPEVLGPDGEAGRIVRRGDPEAFAGAIEELLDDPEQAARMGRAGRRRVVSRFSWSRAAEQVAVLYEEAIRCSR